jgi:hypothetical protein
VSDLARLPTDGQARPVVESPLVPTTPVDPIADVTAQFGAVVDGITRTIAVGEVQETSEAQQAAEDGDSGPTPVMAQPASNPVPPALKHEDGDLCVLVFGGMDLLGNVHSDCAVLLPKVN